MICNPGNPTGYLYTREELERLREIVIRHDLYLIADEVYREFVYDGMTHHSIMSLAGLEEHAIMIDSVSKRYSMCGARIGSIVSKNNGVMSAALRFAQARLSPPTLAQIATEAALNAPESYFTEVNQEYITRRNILVEGLNQNTGCFFARKPRGAFYCMAELPVDDADRFAQWMLSHFDVEGETLMVAPASGFYSDPELGRRQVRLAYVLEQNSLSKSIRILEEALKAYPGRLQ
jgi:aspartate aminotransferase